MIYSFGHDWNLFRGAIKPNYRDVHGVVSMCNKPTFFIKFYLCLTFWDWQEYALEADTFMSLLYQNKRLNKDHMKILKEQKGKEKRLGFTSASLISNSQQTRVYLGHHENNMEIKCLTKVVQGILYSTYNSPTIFEFKRTSKISPSWNMRNIFNLCLAHEEDQPKGINCIHNVSNKVETGQERDNC